MASSPLYWIIMSQNGFSSSRFLYFIYEVYSTWYFGFSVALYRGGGLSLLHSQTEVPHWYFLHTLVMDDISLLYGWTTGNYWTSLYPVYSYGISLHFKNTDGPHWVSLINTFLDGMSLLCNMLAYPPPWFLDLPSPVGVRSMHLLIFLKVYYFLSNYSYRENLWLW